MFFRRSGAHRIRIFAAALFAVVGSVQAGRAETREFHEPRVKGMRLDWCLYWARDCGEPAARVFCQTQGL